MKKQLFNVFAVAIMITFIGCDKVEQDVLSGNAVHESKIQIPFTMSYTENDTVYSIKGVLGSNVYGWHENDRYIHQWVYNDQNRIDVDTINGGDMLWSYYPFASLRHVFTVESFSTSGDTMEFDFCIDHSVLRHYKVYGESGFLSNLVRYNTNRNNSDSDDIFDQNISQEDTNNRLVSIISYFSSEMRHLLGACSMHSIKLWLDILDEGDPTPFALSCCEAAELHKKHCVNNQLVSHDGGHASCFVICGGYSYFYPFNHN